MLYPLSAPPCTALHQASTPLQPCKAWQYDNKDFQNTISEQWDLVCGDKIMTKIGSFVFFAGTGVCVFIAGLSPIKVVI